MPMPETCRTREPHACSGFRWPSRCFTSCCWWSRAFARTVSRYFPRPGHNLSDFLALLLTWVAVYVQSRPPSATKTFGYQRAGVLAAFVNAASLVLIAFFIFYEAAHRLYEPSNVEPRTMMWVAACGVVMNGAIALMLLRTRRDLNMRSAFLHELGDTLSTAAVIVGGWFILATKQTWIDSALSFGIGALVLWSSFGIIRESLNILLEGTPRGMSLHEDWRSMCAHRGRD